jgi:hypothetical protein
MANPRYVAAIGLFRAFTDEPPPLQLGEQMHRTAVGVDLEFRTRRQLGQGLEDPHHWFGWLQTAQIQFSNATYHDREDSRRARTFALMKVKPGLAD